MFGRIKTIGEGSLIVELNENAQNNNILNLHVVIYDNEKFILGEVTSVGMGEAKISLIGEFEGKKFKQGLLRKPNLNAVIRPILKEEIPLILGEELNTTLRLGKSPFYNNHPVFFDLPVFFSNHFAIFGNSGSGKSFGVTRIIQNIFENNKIKPYRSNFIFFDTSGEYTEAFSSISRIDPKFNCRVLSTNPLLGSNMEQLHLPIYLLDVKSLGMLLQVQSTKQLPIIKQMIKYARIFAESENDYKYQNHILAKAIIKVLYSNQSPTSKSLDIISIIEECPTPEINLGIDIKGVGYTRKIIDCFNIDRNGNFTEAVLFTEFINSFINQELDNYEAPVDTVFNIDHLKQGLKFTLISEGWYKNKDTYGDAVLINVRFNDFISSNYRKVFETEGKYSKEHYLSSLLIKGAKKFQILNINLEDVDDWFASTITKIFADLILSYAKKTGVRGSVPFHMIVDEAHRYIRRDDPEQIIYGYNIFERVAKEGRKYGVILGVITQRPVELSDTVISQCSNFLIFKTNHPLDAKYIRDMVPNISEEIAEKQKTLQSGTCIVFGNAFMIPVIVSLDRPNPEPISSNSDIIKYWTYNL